MKVLFAQKIIGVAGSENYLLKMLPALKEEGIQVEFLCLYPANMKGKYVEFASVLKAQDIKVYYAEYSAFMIFSFLKKISGIIKNNNYDIIHTHLIHADVFLSIVKKFYNKGITLVSTKHGYEESYNHKFGFDPKSRRRDLYWWVAKLSEKMMNRSYAISNGLRKLYIGLGICHESKLDLIHYGFDLGKVESNEEFRYSGQQLVLVGRLTEFKGHKYAFEAVAILKNKYPQLKLVIVGSGHLEDELKALSEQLQIMDNVIFTGYNPNGMEYMASSDIVLIPSVAEGFGVVVLEAFAVKKPIVAFNVPSLDEHIQDGVSGRLIEPFNVQAYARAVEELILHPEVRMSYAEEAYKKYITYYTMERMVAQTIDFYEKTLA